jgi:acetamidase/formamidase
MTLSQSPDYLGDLDIPNLRAGSTIHIRANHEGGLLSLGDVHAAQGDGEFGGIAVEIAARVTLEIEVTPRGQTSMNRLPLLVDDHSVGVVAAFQGLPTSLCVRSAAVELCELLVRLGMSTPEAIQYLSAAAHVRLGNMFEPFYSAYVYVDRATMPVSLPDDLLANSNLP